MKKQKWLFKWKDEWGVTTTDLVFFIFNCLVIFGQIGGLFFGIFWKVFKYALLAGVVLLIILGFLKVAKLVCILFIALFSKIILFQ